MHRSFMQIRVSTICAVFIAASACAIHGAEHWWKGNLHTHTLWSDGDDYPEMVADWYKAHGYNFLGLSDHSMILGGEKWIHSVSNGGGAAAFAKYQKRFGDDWIVTRQTGNGLMVRLKTLEEFRPCLEESGRFLMIPSEEISALFENGTERIPVHLNASNVRELIPSQKATNLQEVLQNSINAVLDQRRRTGQPMIVHVNHPNFEWALTAEDIAPLKGERFFEVYNGHPGVHNYGDASRAGTERIWDIVLTLRLQQLGLPAVWGTAVDDAHAYHAFGGKPNPGRGWIMVRAKRLTPEALIAAMEAGDFYATTGVIIKDIRRSRNRLSFQIASKPGVTYKTTFIGTRKGANVQGTPVMADGKTLRTTKAYDKEIGAILSETTSLSPKYAFKGDELYVRARVVSSVPKENPFAQGDMETAWIQPVVVGK